jgi:HEAT repeat protein
MNDPELPMPSDVLRPAVGAEQGDIVEPPSVKLIVRLFVIPLMIVAAAVGVMFLIGLLAGREPSFDEAIARLRSPGGARTADYLIGPGAKQRYLDAKALTDKMKAGMGAAERVKLSGELIDLLKNHIQSDEGEVQHFVLLALGRVWQGAAPTDAASVESVRDVIATLTHYASASSVSTRKAAILASIYLAGQSDVTQLLPMLIEKLGDTREDIDVRIAAATALGPLGNPDNKPVIEALSLATRDTNPEDAELVWSASLSLAELNQPEVADTVLKLLSRDELAKMQYFDRETDPKNPVLRNLNEQEQQRILINTMLGAQKLHVPAVQEKLKQLTDHDPSPRVRAAGMQILHGRAVDSGLPQ